MDLTVCHEPQYPSTSPISTAKRAFAPPRYPSMTRSGNPRAALSSFGTSDGVDPGAKPAMVTGFLAANQSSTLLMPLWLLNEHTVL